MNITKYRVLDIKTGLETVHEFADGMKPLTLLRKLALIDAWNKMSGIEKKYWLEVEH